MSASPSAARWGRRFRLPTGQYAQFFYSYRKKAYAFRALGAMRDTPRRLAASGADTFGFAVLAGLAADGNSVQVLMTNYEIPPAHRKLPRRGPVGDHLGLPPRTNIEYRDNRGFNLKVSHLPWGKGEFSVKRYRVTRTEDWAESESRASGDTLEVTSSLPPPGIELIVVRKTGR